jgi:hypothetical protein
MNSYIPEMLEKQVGFILRICEVKDVLGIVLVGTSLCSDKLQALLHLMPLGYLLATLLSLFHFLIVREFSPHR